MLDKLAQVVPEVGRLLRVMDDARHLDLVHGVDHRRRAAVLAQHLADTGDLDDVEAQAAVALGHVRAEQARVAQGVKRLARKAGVAIDVRRVDARTSLPRACTSCKRRSKLGRGMPVV